MMSKYKNKNKFVDRGVYFVTEGEYKGSFILNIKECNNGNNKAFLLLPDNHPLHISTTEVTDLFERDFFEYVRTIPKKVYKVCMAEYKHRRVE